MPRNRSRNSNIQSTLKDYIVPIIGWVIIILILWSILWGNSENETTNSTWSVIANINFSTTETEVLIEDISEKRTDATDLNGVKSWETIIVREWSVRLSPQTWTEVHLNRVWELQLISESDYSLYSSDAWIETESPVTVSLRYWDVSIAENSIISLTQNEAVSTVYVLNWSAKVSNLWWVSTSVSTGQKVSIARQDAAKDDIDLSNSKIDIDSFFKTSDWFIENDGYIAIQDQENTDDIDVEAENETNPEEIEEQWSTGRYLAFENLSDEIRVNSESITIRWSIISELVWSIELWWISVSINDDGSFTIPLDLPYDSNDIILKVFDTNSNTLEKSVYTIYWPNSTRVSSNTISESNTDTTETTSNNTSWGTNFAADATDFGFTAPSVTGKFSTTGSEITIRWITTADNIETVTVNGFELASFNGSTWRYHAFTRFSTLQDGTNQYQINYLDAAGDIVYTDYYTIVKSAATTPIIPQTASTTPNDSETENTNEEESSDIPDEDALFSE